MWLNPLKMLHYYLFFSFFLPFSFLYFSLYLPFGWGEWSLAHPLTPCLDQPMNVGLPVSGSETSSLHTPIQSKILRASISTSQKNLFSSASPLARPSLCSKFCQRLQM